MSEKHKSQLEYCYACKCFARGSCHDFLKGSSYECNAGNFFQMFTDDLAVHIAQCKGFPEYHYPECEKCVKDTNGRWYGRPDICQACWAHPKSCIRCQHCNGDMDHPICLKHGALNVGDRIVGTALMYIADKCPDHQERTTPFTPPMECRKCEIIKTKPCPFAFRVHECLQKGDAE